MIITFSIILKMYCIYLSFSKALTLLFSLAHYNIPVK